MTIRSLNARLARPSASVALQSEKHTFLDQAVLPVLLTVQYTSGSADNQQGSGTSDQEEELNDIQVRLPNRTPPSDHHQPQPTPPQHHIVTMSRSSLNNPAPLVTTMTSSHAGGPPMAVTTAVVNFPAGPTVGSSSDGGPDANGTNGAGSSSTTTAAATVSGAAAASGASCGAGSGGPMVRISTL